MSRLSDERIMELAEISPIWYAIPQGREKYLLTAFARRIEREAYKQGQERMRDRAVLVSSNHYDELIAGFIRNLEIEEPK